jgi:hypothetical protein
MRRTYVCVAAAGAVAGMALLVWLASPSAARNADRSAGSQQDKSPAAQLPITHVYLFSSGVGYFQREGDVEGTQRVDLTFPAGDVNDLLKSLVLQDLGGGKVSTIGYDSQDPVEKTLKSFALDLTYNPSFGQLLNQARGERVEVVLQQTANGQPTTLSGVIIGMESQRQPAGKDATVEVDMLNLLCTEGVRTIHLKDIQRLRFLNAVLDAELRRALDVLASSHDSLKKTVSLTFKGDGKRGVRVGYVVESPIWKSSYRLVLDKDGKVHLQGWASVENTTDDDWNNVRMALVSGRPISFQMNIYQPLYVPRPMVEPEKFASLRPPVFGGALANAVQIAAGQVPQQPMGGLGLAGGGGGLGGGGLGGGMNPGYMNTNNFAFNRYQLGNGFGQMGGQFGQQGGQNGLQGGMNDATSNTLNFQNNGRLTFDQLQQRRQEQQAARANARKVGSQLAALDPTQGIGSLPTAEEIGDYYRYVIDDKVTLPRQKSAMLAIVNQAIEGTRVSIYNQQVQGKFPLLGLKFKNLTDQPLMQGPITVYDDGSYAGDARLPDLQPKEERLIAYAIDTGTEVKTEDKTGPQQLIALKAAKGIVRATHKMRETKTYIAKNRSPQDRTLIIEHPYREGWKLMEPEKPMEVTREVYRFELKVPAGKSIVHKVVEELSRVDLVNLNSVDDKTIQAFVKSSVSSEKAREALRDVLNKRAKLADTQRELTTVERQLKDITEDQGRLRANLDKVPPSSAAYKRYLEKFDKQEPEIERLQQRIKEMHETVNTLQKELETAVLGNDW